MPWADNMLSKRILVVDDDPDHLLICKLIFERREFDVLALAGCHPLDNFVEEVRLFHPDLIFIDHVMPVVCGRDAIKALRGQPDLRMIPIIYFSAHADLEELAKQVGADDFIEKPFVIEHLLALAKKYSELRAA
jgi:CheY-like chemotaxis protein